MKTIKLTFALVALLGCVVVAASLSHIQKASLVGWITQAEASGYWSCPPYCKMNVKQVALVFSDRIPGLQKSLSKKLATHLMQLSKKHHFDPAFVLSVIDAESSFRPKVRSYAGAVGLMQLMPSTAKFISKKVGIKFQKINQLEDPFINISLGMAYLSYLRDRYQGDFQKMMVAYNLGPGRLDYILSIKKYRIVHTKPYIDAIREGVSYWRLYGKNTLPQDNLTGLRKWLGETMDLLTEDENV